MYTKLAGLLFGATLFVAATPALAASNSEFKVGADGVFSAKNLVVMQVSGAAVYCRAVWDQAYIRLTVLTSDATKLAKNHGGATTVAELEAGDVVDVSGKLVPGSDTLQVTAASVVDHSLNTEPKTVSGTIKSITPAQGSFVIVDKKLGQVSVLVGTSTIAKGIRAISAAELAKGDKVLSAAGMYDFASSTFAATSITVWQDPSAFKPRVFVGTVKTAPGSALPTSMTVSTASADYQVFLASGAKIINANYAPADLARFQVGDRVRLYGSVRQDNLANLDATILRDLNF